MRDTRNQGLALATEPQLITLFRQVPPLNYGFKEVMIRSEIAPVGLGHTLEQQLHVLDPGLPLSEISSMEEYIEGMSSDRRFTSIILTSFAALGVLLAVIGIYGVISYLVVQRTHELGIRLALGAMRSDVLWLVVRQGLRLALFGVALGLAGVALISRSLSSLLYGISAAVRPKLYQRCGTIRQDERTSNCRRYASAFSQLRVLALLRTNSPL
jgi:ABC-type antimicrobial peptide transport system permease subunit